MLTLWAYEALTPKLGAEVDSGSQVLQHTPPMNVRTIIYVGAQAVFGLLHVTAFVSWLCQDFDCPKIAYTMETSCQ